MVRLLLLSVLFLYGTVSEYSTASPTNKTNANKSVSKLAVVRKNNSLQAIKEFLKKGNFTGNLDELLVNIQNTQELLAGMVGKNKLTREQLKNEIDKFNNNMHDIVEKYNLLIKGQKCLEKKDNTKSNNTDTMLEDMPKSSKQVKGHAIITLDCRKPSRLDRLNNPIQELLSPLTEKNIQEFVELDNKEELPSLLGKKDIPDSDAQCHYISISESAEKAILNIEEQKKFSE